MLYTDLIYSPVHVLRYFLYPQIDLVHPTQDPEYLVIYANKDISQIDCSKYVPLLVVDKTASLWRKKGGQ